jgi:sugar phosphate isomerase/epimerase
MKYGYMPNSNADLFEQIKFAKEHFDFIELTLDENLSKYNQRNIQKLKKALKNFEVYGHIHWKIKLYNKDKKEIEKAIKSIKIFKQLGVKNLTIHPSWNKEMNEKDLIKNNLYSLKIVNEFCKKHKLKLMIENIQRSPFNRANFLFEFIGKIPNSKITFDTGHSAKVSKFEFAKFLNVKNKIGHLHLHDCVKGFDHLDFKNKSKLKKIVNKIKDSGYNKTITLEIFTTLKNKKQIELDYKKRRKILIDHLAKLKE